MTDKNTIYRSNDKRFLDPDSTTGDYEGGSMMWNVRIVHAWPQKRTEENKHIKLKNRASLQAELKISDCSRTITLDFNAGSDAQTRKDRIAKLDNMIDGLKKFRTALAKADKAATSLIAAPFVEIPEWQKKYESEGYRTIEYD